VVLLEVGLQSLASSRYPSGGSIGAIPTACCKASDNVTYNLDETKLW
jgi:hypothetical protein